MVDAQQLDGGTLAIRPTPFDLVELVGDVAALSLPADRVVSIVGDAVLVRPTAPGWSRSW